MSKYDRLWEYVRQTNQDKSILSFDEIERICGFPLDHSFLTNKKELTPYGYAVQKISMKEKNVLFIKI